MKPLKNYPTALRKDVIEWATELKTLDILVGIPSFNNEDTIRHVIEVVAMGLHEYYPKLKKAIYVSDGGSLDDTREEAMSAKIPDDVFLQVSIYRGVPGKGTSFRAVFELADRLNVDACAAVDSDLRSIEPFWIHHLLQPILDKKADFVAPYYQRHKYDGTITNHIVYPLTRALYGKDIRQPIGGDFGYSGGMAKFWASKDVWLTDVAKFGIDIWMTTTAINEGARLMQANLGAKIHDPKDPAEDLGPMFQQVVSTLFYLMGEYESNWRKQHQTQTIPLFGELKNHYKLPPVAVTLSKLQKEFVDGFEHFSPLYKMVLSPENFQTLTQCYEQTKKGDMICLSPDLWAQILYDFAFTYQGWTRNRRRLVDIITPIYFGRVGAYCLEVKDMNDQQAEQVIQNQAQTFEKDKSYLMNLFEAWD